MLAKVPVHLRRTQSTVHYHWVPHCDHISQLMPKWNSCCTVGDLALLSQQLYFICILCLQQHILCACPRCDLLEYCLLGNLSTSNVDSTAGCSGAVWDSTVCTIWYSAFFVDATIWLSEYSLYVTGVLFNNFTKLSGSFLTKDFFLDVFLFKILCTLNVWPLSGLHGSWF